MKASVIIPCFNEEKRLAKSLPIFKESLPSDFEIIVAADGCRDRTVEIAEAMEVVVSSDTERLGKGEAIKRAVAKASGEYIITADVDFVNPSRIPIYFESIQDGSCDILIGKRFFPHDRPKGRQLAGRLFSGLVRNMFGNLPDVQSGLKFIKAEVLKKLLPKIKSKGYAWDLELIVNAKKAGYIIRSIDVIDWYDSDSKVHVIQDGASMLKSLIRLWLCQGFNSLILGLFLLLFSCVTLASAVTSVPIGIDYYFHLQIARIWAAGGNGMFSSIVFQENRFPYPPIFHWLLVPSVWLHVEYAWARILEVVFPSGTFAGVLWLTYRYSGSRQAAVAGLILLGNFSFIDSTICVRPQSLDLLLIPVMLYFFLSRKSKSLLSSIGALAYNHGVAAIANFWALILYGSFKGYGKKFFAATCLILLPITLISIFYLKGALTTWSGHTETMQEFMIFANPLRMIPLYSGISLIGFPFLLFTLTRWSKSSQFDKAAGLTLLSLFLMLPLWADRFLQYATIPLAMLAASGLGKNRTVFFGLLPFFVAIAAIYQFNFWWISLTGNWWTP